MAKEKVAKKDKKATKEVCLACTCPCEMHKEHNHPVEDKGCGCCK